MKTKFWISNDVLYDMTALRHMICHLKSYDINFRVHNLGYSIAK